MKDTWFQDDTDHEQSHGTIALIQTIFSNRIFNLLAMAFMLIIETQSIAFSASASLTWDANSESDLAGYKLYYGTSSGTYGTPVDLGDVTSFTISGLPGSLHFFALTAYDVSDNESALSIEVSKNLDGTGPLISSIASGNLSSSAATISWSTNEAADGQTEYGTSTSYGSTSTLDSTLATSHSESLSGLSGGTLYHYRILSRDAAGNLTTSGNNTFTTTTPPDTTPPLLSGITASNISGTSATITWSTDENADSEVAYGTTTAYGSTSSFDATLLTSHSRTINGLSDGISYQYQVISTDASGNVSRSANKSFTTDATPDTTAPALSGFSASATATSVTVIWSSDEAATSQIEYGTTPSYGSFSNKDETLVTDHSQTISELSPSTTYYYRVYSLDGSGNSSVSNGTNITTAAVDASDDTPPADITAFEVLGGDQQITLSWINPPDSDFVGVRIRYRTDRSPTDINDGEHLGDISGDPGATTSTLHTGLAANTTYYYLAASYDENGNFQTTVFGSGTTLSTQSQNSSSSGGGGCGIIKPGNGNGPNKPQDAAAMMTIIGSLILLLVKKRWQQMRFAGQKQRNILR